MKRIKATMTIEKAIDTLKGYCLKHATCDNCRFKIDNDCFFERNTMPCDWDFKRSDNNV